MKERYATKLFPQNSLSIISESGRKLLNVKNSNSFLTPSICDTYDLYYEGNGC